MCLDGLSTHISHSGLFQHTSSQRVFILSISLDNLNNKLFIECLLNLIEHLVTLMMRLWSSYEVVSIGHHPA